MARRIGGCLLLAAVLLAVFAPALSPNAPGEQFPDRSFAPPMTIHVRDAEGFHAPFVYRQVLEDRLMRRYGEDLSVRIPIEWFAGGRFMTIDRASGPLLLLGGDVLGRDTWSRLLSGARLSLGVTLVGVAGALAIGALIGAFAGGIGGRLDTLLMLAADFVIVLPGAYLILVLRGVLPIVLTTRQVFGLMAVLFAFSGWPHVARGVRAIVATERARDYAEAARAAGAGHWRLIGHLVPAARGFLGVEVLLLVPAMLVAETTISFLGLGFAEPAASWGTMLHDIENVNLIAGAPWILAPALALFLVVLGVQLVVGRRAEPVLLVGATARMPAPGGRWT